MKKQNLASFLIFSFLVTAAVALTVACLHDEPRKLTKQERIEGAIEYTKLTSSDVDLGIVPEAKRIQAIEEGQRRLKAIQQNRSGSESLADAVWRSRGPSNRGGRTRAIMIDEKDPTRNRIWVGGVSGGLWRSEDITQSDPGWRKLGIYFESLAISDIKQDPNDLNTIYVTTGESYTGDVPGSGIWKSTDDGETWSKIPSTNTSVFNSVNEIYIHTNGDIYVASSQGGILRSTDNGETWLKVAGSGLSGGNSNDFHDILFHPVDNQFYACDDFTIWKSATGDRGDWTNIGSVRPGFATNVNRLEFTMCPTDPNVIYAIGNVSSFSSNTLVTSDGGDNWSQKAVPPIFGSYGQAWYDLDIACDPTNCLRVLAGGVVMTQGTAQGATWREVTPGMHVDHHNITYDPKKPGRVLFGNDGGIWLSEDYGQTSVDRSAGFVTTQFYACAIHPDAGSPYIMGGTQDNNSLIIEQPGLSPSRTAWGGDGIFCFIDQNEPNIQIVSSQGGNYGLSINGGFSFGFGASIDGAFINRSDYDDDANILYGQVNQSGVNDVDFFRWNINSGLSESIDISNYNVDVTAVTADPNVDNRVYFGGQSGLVIRVDNAHEGASVPGTVYADLPGNARVSCIYKDKSNGDHALISLFNYGAGLDNIWVTYDDGGQWTSIEGDLPDLPVRWAMFDPADHDRVMIATDAGIWVTDDVDGDQTHWVPNSADNGMPFVRVDMLQLRDSDKVVLAGTYGRGLLTTDVFSAPAAVIVSQEVAYEGQTVRIDGSFSVNAQSYEWNLGDNTTATTPVVEHVYNQPGTYTLQLTINGNVTQTKTIAVLPYLPAPYMVGNAGYAGDFESLPEHFAAVNYEGTPLQRGRSDKPGKDGTNSGANAWVLGINDNLYANGTRAELYTPMYDLSNPGLYEFRFYGKWAIQSPHDGLQVEYSVNGGVSWQQLGSRDDPMWYNYLNSNLTTGAFPQGKSYFTNAQLAWKQYAKDISFLAGQPAVSFRFVFRTDKEEQAQGFALDDIEIFKYEGDLRTTVTKFSAEYVGDQEVKIDWTTGLEYQCRKFYLERSYTGFGFTQIAELNAKGGVSTFPQNYTHSDPNLRSVIFYRMRVLNENTDLDYFYEFYTDTIVVRRGVEANQIQYVLTNPFTDRILISFSSIVDTDVSVRLFDAAGKLLREDIVTPNAVAYSFDGLSLPTGVYIVSVQVGRGEIKSYKLFCTG